jgi:hypothetical protein
VERERRKKKSRKNGKLNEEEELVNWKIKRSKRKMKKGEGDDKKEIRRIELIGKDEEVSVENSVNGYK